MGSSVTEVAQTLGALFPAFGHLHGGSRGENHPFRAPFWAVLSSFSRKDGLHPGTWLGNGTVAVSCAAAGESSAGRPRVTARSARNRGAPVSPAQAGAHKKKMKKNAHPVVRLQRTHCERQWRPLFGNVVLRNNGPHCLPYMGAGQWGALNPDGGLRCTPFSQRVRRKKRHGEQEKRYGKSAPALLRSKTPLPEGGGGLGGPAPPPSPGGSENLKNTCL